MGTSRTRLCKFQIRIWISEINNSPPDLRIVSTVTTIKAILSTDNNASVWESLNTHANAIFIGVGRAYHHPLNAQLKLSFIPKNNTIL